MNKLTLSNTTLVVSLRCNLRCRLCAVHAPYYDTPPHFTFDELSLAVRKYFASVSYVEKFTINGGEPLMHPELPQITAELLTYSSQIGMLEILTNGTIVPGDALLDVLRTSDKIDVMVNDYGTERSKAREACAKIASCGIRHRYREQHDDIVHFGGWVDLSDLTKKDRTAAETADIYSRCAYPGAFRCFVIIGGRGYICGVYKRAEYSGVIAENSNEYVDFLDRTTSVEAIREKIRNFSKRDFFSACEYCNGFCSDSKRFTPAKQLP